METLEMLQKRIGSFASDSLPGAGGFSTRESCSLLPKVDAEGTLLPFWGNTAVFLLDAEMRAWVREIQEDLHKACGDLLAREALSEDTLHMTLHDLCSGAPDSDIFRRVNDTRERALSVLDEVRREMGTEPIRMRPAWVFSMVNTSIVLGLEPVSEADCERLMHAYERFHEVVVPSYPYLTPHITLAYYRSADFDGEQLAHLRSTLERLNAAERARTSGGDMRPLIALRADDLVYQEFGSMNRYRTVR